MFISETNQSILVLIMLVYGVAILAYSYYFYRRTRTYDSFNMGGRSMPLLPMILTIVGGAVGGSTVLGFVTNAYLLGMGQIWNVASLAFSVVIFTLFFLKRIRKAGDEHQLFSVGDYAAIRYGNAARYPAFIGNIAALGALTGLQFVALATVFNLVFGLEMTIGIIVSWIFITLKTYLGGLTAVIWTDAVQGTIQTLGITILFFFIYFLTGGWSNVSENVSQTADLQAEFLNPFTMPISEILIPFLTIGAATLVRQDMWQRVWAAKNIRTSVISNWLACLVIFITGALVIIIGVFANAGLGIAAEQPNLIYYEVIFGAIPFWFGSVMLIALVATILSCADSFFIAGSTTMVSDIIKPLLKVKSDAKLLRYSRLMIIAMSVISLILALAIPRLVELWMTGSAILVAALLAPILIGMFWEKPGKLAGVASMWSGLILTLVWQFAGQPFGVHPVFVGFPLSLIVLLAITFFQNNDNSTKNTSEDCSA
ncbi:sodium:solute symporter [Alteribacillus sp. YIM 98480]|uniref:sodium:solute symporter family protein n=1 Tax=Alteribacillus sp. YIM 98480 TaxID=2606599 RepID=UPI00131BD9C6|nr:sodium:solute symporter family protein [Alteribacillus sp. YIM 98480]